MNGDCRAIAPTSPTASAEPFFLTLWTADPALARRADAAGVDRIGVDLEQLGKHERQRGRDTWISPHSIEDLDRLALTRARRFARVNGWHDGSPGEIEAVLSHGAQVVMLAMTLDKAQAAAFVATLRGRATPVLLVEHEAALRRIAAIAAVDGVEEIHIGLNDLALSLGLRNRWLAFEGERIADAGAAVRAAGRRFGLGGIGRVDDAGLPVPSDLVYAQYARTGARAAVLARSFHRDEGDLAVEIRRARARLADWRAVDPARLEAAHAELLRCARLADVW